MSNDEVVEQVQEAEVETAEVEAAVAAPEAEDAVKPEVTEVDVKLVEAILFASAAPIDISTIAERFAANRAAVIPDALAIIQEHYQNRGINLVKRDNRWAFRTADDIAEMMKLEKETLRKFTRAAMETMAIIAYHQPVTRAEIENIRGVSISTGSLDSLIEAGWIKPGKRRQVPGRPVTWVTTKEFLDHFGLENIQDLPGMEELKASGLLDKRPAIDAMPTSDLFDGDINKDREIDDPQEVTDEDLLGDTQNSDEVDFDLSEEDDEDLEDEDFREDSSKD